MGSYFAIASVVCMNLYIALLSETFARVYQNAKANAALLQATTILQVEKALSKKRKSKADEFIQKQCSPMVRKTVFNWLIDLQSFPWLSPSCVSLRLRLWIAYSTAWMGEKQGRTVVYSIQDPQGVESSILCCGIAFISLIG